MHKHLQKLFQQRFVHIGILCVVVFSTIAVGIAVLPHQQAKAANNTDDILLVHGYNVGAVSPCDVFGTVQKYFPGLGWSGNIKALYYYSNKGQCDTPMDFGDTRCDNYHTNDPDPFQSYAEGQTSETIQHLGCRFAWYVWDNYTSQNKNVRVIAHSMGGVVVRWAMYATKIRDKNTLGQNALPSSLGISRIVTVSSPHNGASFPHNGGGPGIVVDEQGAELDPGSDFLKVLNSSTGLDPEVGSTYTYWTTIGSEGDNTVSDSSAIYMGSDAKIVYRKAPFNDPNMKPQNLDHGSILSDGVSYDPSGKAYMDTRPIAPVKYCDANCGVGTPSSMSQPFYYRSVYAVYLHITDSLVPPTPTPVPPTATPPNPTATPLPSPPVACSSSLNPHWAYENSNTVDHTYTGLRNLGYTYNLTVEVHVELQSWVDNNNNYCGLMRTITSVGNASGSCTATYCDLYGTVGAYTHYQNGSGTAVDSPTTENSGGIRTGFNTTGNYVVTACAAGAGYFTPLDETLDVVIVGMGQHCRTAPACGNATISNPTQSFNLNGVTGTLGVYLEKGQYWNGIKCVFNGLQIAVAEVHMANGAASGRITAQIFGNENPPLGHNHQDVDFTSTTYADATTTNSQSCGHARADLTINGAFLRIETGTYCG